MPRTVTFLATVTCTDGSGHRARLRKAVTTVTNTFNSQMDPDDEEPNKEENPRYRHVENSEAFGPQPTSSSELPDPTEFATKLVGGIIECVHGLREPIQFTRYVNDDVYRALTTRINRMNQSVITHKKKQTRPRFSLGNVVLNSPRDGIVEAAVVVHGPSRVRAVALRLEGLDRRWRATSFSML